MIVQEIKLTEPRKSASVSKQFSTLADAVQNMSKAVKRLPLFYQELFLRQPPFQRQRPPGLAHLKSFHERFLNELNYAAAWAEEQSEFHKVPQSDRRRDYQKLAAAQGADWFLFEFGKKKPSLSPGSDFLELASTLYEAATEKVSVDLRWQCRTVIEEHKRK